MCAELCFAIYEQVYPSKNGHIFSLKNRLKLLKGDFILGIVPQK